MDTIYKAIFDHCGLSNVWRSQDQLIEKSIELRLKDQFKQEWSSDIFNCSKTICYRLYKTEFLFEQYISILPPYLMNYLCKFRCGSHRLPIETGRWENIQRSDRLCHLCNLNRLGDEYHFIMDCPFFKRERNIFLPQYCQTNSNILKFEQLMSSKDKFVLEKLAKYVKIVLRKVVPPG